MHAAKQAPQTVLLRRAPVRMARNDFEPIHSAKIYLFSGSPDLIVRLNLGLGNGYFGADGTLVGCVLGLFDELGLGLFDMLGLFDHLHGSCHHDLGAEQHTLIADGVAGAGGDLPAVAGSRTVAGCCVDHDAGADLLDVGNVGRTAAGGCADGVDLDMDGALLQLAGRCCDLVVGLISRGRSAPSS